MILVTERIEHFLVREVIFGCLLRSARKGMVSVPKRRVPIYKESGLVKEG